MVHLGHLAHFGHANIIKYCKRPFTSTSEMDAALIRNWNSVVNHDDLVYHLGDFAVGGGPAINYLPRLNGQIRFVWGNHDNRLKACKEQNAFPVDVEHLREVTVDGQRITLCHYAMRIWNKSHHGSWHLYGHSHGTLPDDPNSLSLDIGVDCWNYTPVSIHQIKERMKKKTFKAIDHHGPQTT